MARLEKVLGEVASVLLGWGRVFHHDPQPLWRRAFAVAYRSLRSCLGGRGQEEPAPGSGADTGGGT